jgi:hypothetical protein
MRSILRHASIALALAVLGLTAGSARADGLYASAGDRYGDTTAFVAGGPAAVVSTLLRPLARGQFIAGAASFNDDSLACVLVGGRRRPASLSYRLAFNWNHAIGAASVRSSGDLPVVATPRNELERTCENEFRSVQGDGPPA